MRVCSCKSNHTRVFSSLFWCHKNMTVAFNLKELLYPYTLLFMNIN